ncbi:MAG TPA: glycoside hydrolase family 38 C-terminal domain-containing protein [Pyrinomonadaceae bacterium]|nr:glycoside hydrolase family 38 C-terminal domain-containing protein [Pyrinomonadaceae bacterium]
MRRRYLSALVLTFAFALGVRAQDPVTVWQIGEFDSSAGEFGAQAAGVFDAASGQAGSWGATQQAVVEPKADASASRRIRFELREVPRGGYTLRLGLIMSSPRLPVVQVEVNGHRGWFYQRPETDFKEGNLEANIFPQYAVGTLEAGIPEAFLRRGVNEITLTAVNDPASAALPGGEDTSDSLLRYDALALERGNALSRPEDVAAVASADVLPTVIYKREAGTLKELVSVVVRWSQFAAPGTVTLKVSGRSQTQQLRAAQDFGEERVDFYVPEFAAGTLGEVSVRLGGRERSFEEKLTPKRKWTVYLVPHEHLDVGYSDFQTKLAELHSRVIDEALDMTTKRPEFRFSLDGYWQAQQFLEGRSDEERRKFYAAVRERKLFVPAQHSVMLTGMGTAETLLRSFYASHKFNREHGGPWDYVNITDVPSYTWSYASILSAAGLKYFSAAANADRGPTLMLGDLHRRSPFWWEGPDGSRVLVWYARHYHQIGSEFGFPPKVATGFEGLRTFLDVYERDDYAASSVLLHGSQWENTSLHATQADIVRDWNATFAYPRLEFAGFGEALAKIEAGAKEKIPVVRGDGGPYWEDGVASDALYAAIERENERRALSAEKLSTVASLVDARTRPPRAALDSMWESIFLMNEHTWGWGRSVTEPHSEDSERELAYKRLRAVMARDQVDHVAERAMAAIAGSIETPQRALVVFNTLNWARDGWVEFDLQKTRELVDIETRKVVPFEVLRDEPAYQRIRFMARAVPSVGYRTYQVRDRAAGAPAETPSATSTAAQAGAPSQSASSSTSAPAASQPQPDTIENDFYRVRLDAESGSIRSIYDKQLGRGLVDESSPYRFGQYVYVTGGDAFPNQMLTYRKTAPVARLEIHKGASGRIVSVTKTPTGTVARLESSAPNTPRVSTEVVLFDGAKKVEINSRVRKEEVYKKEGIYFAFPVAVREPRFNFDVQTAVVNPARDMIPGAGLEWFSSQNWAAAGDDALTVAIVNRDSFLWTFGDIVRGTWPKEFRPRSSALFSYVMNNYWNTNYVAAQGGEFTFRYTLTSARSLDQTALARLGWEETTPLERTLVKSQDQTYPARKTLPAAQSSLLGVDNPSALLSAWKQSEDGVGTVMRFIELRGEPGGVRLSGPLVGGASGRACNAVEECGPAFAGGTGGLSFVLKPRQIYTLKVNPPAAER